MTRFTLYLRGLYLFWHAVYKMRTKKHGAGKQPWKLALRMGTCARYIVYGQHYHPRNFTAGWR